MDGVIQIHVIIDTSIFYQELAILLIMTQYILLSNKINISPKAEKEPFYKEPKYSVIYSLVKFDFP